MPGYLDLQMSGAIALSLLAAVVDVFTSKIPNYITVAGVLLGLVAAGAASAGVLPSESPVLIDNALLTMIGVLATVLFVYSMGVLGGGDAKLLVALAVWVGFPAIIVVLFYTLLAAMALIVIICCVRGKLLRLLLSMVFYAGALVYAPFRDKIDGDILKMRLPFGVAIFLGICTWCVQTILGISYP